MTSNALLGGWSRLPGVSTTIFTLMSALAVEHKAINLGQGFPDFSPPKLLVSLLSQAAEAGHNQYAPMIGAAPLRSAIAAMILEKYSATIDPNSEITITSGATEALLNSILAVVRPQGGNGGSEGGCDEVLMLDPCYDSYAPAVALAGARAVRVALEAKTGFGVDWKAVEAAANAKTRLLILNTPHNPTGAILREGDITKLRALMRAHPQLLLVSDEVYEHMVFDGHTHHSMLRHPDLAARSFVVSSFGKTYHCTGWKLGYCVAPAELSQEFRKVHQFNTFSSFTPVQIAIAEMLHKHPEHHRGLSDFYQEKRDAFQRQLREQTLLTPLDVPGGFFQLVDYSRVSDLSDYEFCRWLTIEHGVTAIPLSPFYRSPPPGQRLARLCFAKESATLTAAIDRLGRIQPKR